jgi:hypothetical protein
MKNPSELRSAWPSSPLAENIFELNGEIRSVLLVDERARIRSFASRTKVPVDPSFVDGVASIRAALIGGLVKQGENLFGYLRLVHLEYSKLHIYGWPVEGGYLFLTSRSELDNNCVMAAITKSSGISGSASRPSV